MKRIYYFLRSYIVDLITAFTGIMLAFVTFKFFQDPKKQLESRNVAQDSVKKNIGQAWNHQDEIPFPFNELELRQNCRGRGGKEKNPTESGYEPETQRL